MVKPGYKQTEIGAIPENWEVVTIGDVASFQGGSQPPIQHFAFQEQEGYIRLVQIRDYKTDKYLTYIPISLAKRFCTKDDIMIGRYGPPIFQILRGIEGSYNVALIKATPKDVDKEFLFYIIKAEPLFEYIDLLSRRSSGQTGVDLDGLREYKIGLPPKSEQICIADALSNMDKLISIIEKQIAKKKGIKQGAMQELLTGKKRLPGFSGEWKEYVLSDICQLVNGRAYSQVELLSSGKYCVLRLGNLFTNEHWYYSDLELPEKQYCSKGDLIYAWSGTFGPHIWNGEKVIYHYHIWRVDLNALAYKEYVYHYLRADVQSLMAELQGGTMAHLTKESMEKRTIMMPEYNEQVAIAEILSNMDSEIEALEQKLAKYRQVKQGMMQQLLTGKIRLI